MIVDTSAVVAILNEENERDRFELAIASADCELSSVSYLEASIVLLHRRGEETLASLDTWIESAGIAVTPFTPSQARLARSAYARYGKGRHRAGLNFGDCAAYALAMDRDDDLLYQGDDFARTDVRTVQSD
ncbi:MAG: type II toxin-antitoxin system VapC family toxin [Candidatus Eremiobacteraeota bacterium]|nr:type II toxin-antitoxin system VapC family toxin [Candidatus Eremiobacteraeota bacterium]MBC5803079.1 type II toxin-antitoxin system VapC family toxin [Candidatus Eremiobacteraeota bacterium]MBC5823098.1 type II toxin-antitoxin system VapC family toxin [Candidatus Eremiobacteraeota bacterium]